jgi:hypothetical protein
MANLNVTHEEIESMDYAVNYRDKSSAAPKGSRSDRHTFGRSRVKAPQQFNGMHRRRRKKLIW